MARTPSKPSVTKLSDFLCFAVYSANLAFGRAYRPILDKLGLTYTQYVTMVALWDEDDQTVGALGEKLFLEFQHPDPNPQEARDPRIYRSPA